MQIINSKNLSKIIENFEDGLRHLRDLRPKLKSKRHQSETDYTLESFEIHGKNLEGRFYECIQGGGDSCTLKIPLILFTLDTKIPIEVLVESEENYRFIIDGGEEKSLSQILESFVNSQGDLDIISERFLENLIRSDIDGLILCQDKVYKKIKKS